MFNEQERTAYQSIRAPQELYDKVMTAKKPAKRWGKYVPGLAAACLVLVMTAGLFFRGSDPVIVIQGQQLESSIEYFDLAPASEMRSSPMLTVPVELELSKRTQVCVTQGQLTDGEGQTAGELTVSGSVTLLWEIPRGADMAQCEMRIGTGKNATVLTLEYEESKITLTKKGD